MCSWGTIDCDLNQVQISIRSQDVMGGTRLGLGGGGILLLYLDIPHIYTTLVSCVCFLSGGCWVLVPH